MRFAVEFSAAAEHDLELIFDHLVESYLGFGEGAEGAVDHAAQRVMAIRNTADRLARLPFCGTLRDDILPGVRFLAVDRAIYWFDVDEAARRVRVLAVFFGGQHHVRRMLLRLLDRN